MRYNLQTVFFLLFTLIAFSACRFNPEIQKPGHPSFQGVWEEEPLSYRDSLILHTKHTFRFSCDSFYVSIETFSKANYYADSCFRNGHWKEYAKGNYVVRNDTLYIIGTYTKENFKQKLSGCFRTGQYIPMFLIRKTSPEKIELMNLEQHLPMTLKLKEKTTCTPQPL